MNANSIQRTARITGLWYLIFIVALAFATFVRSNLIVFGDAAATANHIKASEWLFRIGFVSDILSAVFFFLAAWGLYVLLRPVNRNLALLLMLLNLGGDAILCLNTLNQLAAVLILNGADYL